MSNIQSRFAREVLSLDKRLNEPMMDDCMKYGLVFGCNVNCPVLISGECELMHDENAKLYKECVETHSLEEKGEGDE